jgi:hypothetical protein
VLPGATVRKRGGRTLPFVFKSEDASVVTIAGANVAAKICAVHFDLTGNGRAFGFRCKRFADFLSKFLMWDLPTLKPFVVLQSLSAIRCTTNLTWRQTAKVDLACAAGNVLVQGAARNLHFSHS